MSFRSPQNGYIYKIETHCHTAELSPCGNIPVRELIDRYAAAGYSAITLCDHLRVGYTLPREGDRHAVADRMADVYENAVEYGKTRGMRVYKGSELCFDATCPDEFIMLGWDRSFLRRTVDLLDRETVGEYHLRTLARGGLLIQAHPFRGECLPVEGEAVDGYAPSPRFEKRPRGKSRSRTRRNYDRRLGLSRPRRCRTFGNMGSLRSRKHG